MRSSHSTLRIALALMLVLSHPMWAATIIVDETTCTLVDAVTAANTDAAVGGCTAGSGDDTIQLTTDVTLTTINNTDSRGANGLPRVVSIMTVEGGGFTIERDPGAPPFRLFFVEFDTTFPQLTLDDVTVRNGSGEEGGAVHSRFGRVVLTNSTMSGNTSTGRGGAVFGYYGDVSVTDSSISGNTAGGSGGGIHAYTVLVSDSVVSDNVSGGSGGGLSTSRYGMGVTNSVVSNNHAARNGGGVSGKNISITASTVSDNTADEEGGGLFVYTTSLEHSILRLTNSTVSGNAAGQRGGGMFVDCTFFTTANHLKHSTISGNSAPIGGGVARYATTFAPQCLFSFESSIIANSGSGGNCVDGIEDNGVNFSDDDSCGPGFDLITGLDPILADNGGPTPTHALLPGSSAIDAAGVCDLTTDQRGLPRNDGACDSGSYEWQGGLCGDGNLDPGEECDDGNDVSCDGCSSTCAIEVGWVCGDGTWNPGCGEECDDGNNVDEDGCSASCVVEFCGDSVLQAGLGEECDDGNDVDEDGCSSSCVIEFCGDGVLQAGLGEECDDGNNANGDGCAADCTIEVAIPAVTSRGAALLALILLVAATGALMRRRRPA